MDTRDHRRYFTALRTCVDVAVRNGFTPEQVATDIRLLITPPSAGTEVYMKLDLTNK